MKSTLPLITEIVGIHNATFECIGEDVWFTFIAKSTFENDASEIVIKGEEHDLAYFRMDLDVLLAHYVNAVANVRGLETVGDWVDSDRSFTSDFIEAEEHFTWAKMLERKFIDMIGDNQIDVLISMVVE